MREATKDFLLCAYEMSHIQDGKDDFLKDINATPPKFPLYTIPLLTGRGIFYLGEMKCEFLFVRQTVHKRSIQLNFCF